MDFVKKAVQGSGEKKDQNAQGGTGTEQKDDYVDKAFGMASKRSGHNIDRNTQEKITDGGRQAYEKATG
ncbi:hypothetical protein OCS_04393 [Ophiocordyceps sinensis CO18]|nr:hypothetical protein OCS_04393 [Ophiocordyceps sinensis CO18]